MAKPGVRAGGLAESPRRAAARRRVVEAAVETLKREGFAGTSARAIAATGGFTQGLVFYHFGTLTQLLVAALEHTSDQRMARYSSAVAGAGNLGELLAVARQVYVEDLEAGHLTVLAELIAASSTIPELGPEIARMIRTWTDFTRHALAAGLAGTGLEALVPADEAAFAIVALYLGIELLSHLEGDRGQAESLFDAGLRLAGLLGALTTGPPRQERSSR
jgi:AcrR family transcriptional regulator